jgi:hypothetical protein
MKPTRLYTQYNGCTEALLVAEIPFLSMNVVHANVFASPTFLSGLNCMYIRLYIYMHMYMYVGVAGKKTFVSF